jgi:hypothetical protein
MTAQTPAPTPLPIAERLGVLLYHIGVTLAGRVSWTTLSPLLVARVCKRFRLIKWRFERIEALVSKGEYKPRRRSATASPGARKPPPPPPDPRMRQFGWLEQVLPDAAMRRGNFLALLRDPQMVALIEAAPVPLVRPLRSICWMLKLKPPPILALPPRPKKPRPSMPPPEPAAAPEPLSPRRLPPEVLARWPHASPLLRRAGFPVNLPPPRARRPPKPA